MTMKAKVTPVEAHKGNQEPVKLHGFNQMFAKFVIKDGLVTNVSKSIQNL